MLRIFRFLETMTLNAPKSKRFLYNLFIPFFLFLEWLVYYYYWKNIIVKELLTSDEIVNFFDANDFGYTGNKIYKADLLASNEFFDRLNMEEAKNVIRKEYIDTVSNILANNISINVEDFLNLQVTVEIKVIKHKGEYFRDKIYTVTIKFCRYYYLQKALTTFYILMGSLISLGMIIHLIFLN